MARRWACSRARAAHNYGTGAADLCSPGLLAVGRRFRQQGRAPTTPCPAPYPACTTSPAHCHEPAVTTPCAGACVPVADWWGHPAAAQTRAPPSQVRPSPSPVLSTPARARSLAPGQGRSTRDLQSQRCSLCGVRSPLRADLWATSAPWQALQLCSGRCDGLHVCASLGRVRPAVQAGAGRERPAARCSRGSGAGSASGAACAAAVKKASGHRRGGEPSWQFWQGRSEIWIGFGGGEGGGAAAPSAQAAQSARRPDRSSNACMDAQASARRGLASARLLALAETLLLQRQPVHLHGRAQGEGTAHAWLMLSF